MPATASKPAPSAAAVAAPPAAASASVPAPLASAAPASTAERWHALVDTLGLDGMTRQFARHCAWLSQEAGVLRFALDPRAKHLQTEERRAAVEAALVARLGALSLVVEPVAVPGQLHPAALDEQKVIDRQRDAEKAIEQDPVVTSFRTLFGATVRAGSIQPIDPTTH